MSELLESPPRDEASEAESDRLHAQVQTILRLGLGVSVALMGSGVAVRLLGGVRDAPPVRLFDLVVPGDVGLTLTALGILTLALTPALRVLALLALWWRERDHRFVLVALFVVATLVVSVSLGKGG